MFRECGQKNISFRNKTFLFFKIESWNFQNQFEKEFRETSQSFNSIRQPIENNNSMNKLNELKFCEVSRNSFSNSCWNFQLSILKKKSFIPKKKIFLAVSPRYIQKMALAVSIFQKVLQARWGVCAAQRRHYIHTFVHMKSTVAYTTKLMWDAEFYG